MIQFLTAIPVPLNLDVNNEDFGKGLVFAPVVGMILGGILAFAYYVLGFAFPNYINGAAVVIIYIMLTGGLHLDGFGDTFDGLFSNRPKERKLEIMRDSRVGTNAVLAVYSILTIDILMLTAIGDNNALPVIILMPVAGRIGSLVSAGVSTYARSTEGLGKSFIDYCGLREILTGLLISVPLFWIAGGLKYLLLLPLPVISAIIIVKFFSRKIGGATGDILGAVCELNQTVFLIGAYLLAWGQDIICF